MKDKAKVNRKPVSKEEQEREQKRQNRFFLFMSFLFLLALLISFMVPVYYVPLFNNIASKYGLSIDITRKLTLLDLALNSFGIETPNMVAAFKQQNVEYEPDVFYISRFFETGTGNRLINAKETYYHEYERTHKRPAEIAGIYQNKTAVSTPEISGNLKGVRALPKNNYFDDFGSFNNDDGSTDFSYKKATATTASQDEVMGSKRRKVRGSFDRENGLQGQSARGSQGQESSSKKPEPLPDFASSVYDKEVDSETQTLENSRMVKPVVSGEEFSVTKPEGAIAKLVGDSSFTDSLASLSNFGGYEGVLGYYIKDDLPKKGLFDFFGETGQEVFSSYFYSHAAVGRKYLESSKHLSEIAFHGDEPQDELLIAKGQKEDKVPPSMDEANMSPISLILTMRQNIKECNEGRQQYEETVRSLKTEYDNLKNQLKNISLGHPSNPAENGAPGSCNPTVTFLWGLIEIPVGSDTTILRNQWNGLLPQLKAKCLEIENAQRAYAEACKMDFSRDDSKDDCNSIDAFEVLGGQDAYQLNCPTNSGWTNCTICIIWKDFYKSKTFRGCISRDDCAQKQDDLFEEIDKNIQLEPQSGFIFS